MYGIFTGYVRDTGFQVEAFVALCQERSEAGIG